jgi:uncharacterized membrane protein YgcG
MSDFGKDITGIIVLLIGVAFAALLVGHAAGTGYLIQQGSVGLNTLLNTVELTPTATNGPGTQAGGGTIGGVFSGAGTSASGTGGLLGALTPGG